MESLSSTEAAATSSSSARETSPFRLRARRVAGPPGESSSLASEHPGGLRHAAGESSQQASGDIEISFSEPRSLVTDPSSTTSSVPNGKAVKIPYIRRPTYIFPDASNSISQAHRDRFTVLQDIFRRNVEADPKLSDFTRHISYELRLCGPSLADATPSIVVFCALKKLRKLKSLLTKPHILSQLQKESWMSGPFSFGLSTTALRSSLMLGQGSWTRMSSSVVSFGLFFWAQPIDMLALHEVTVVIPEKQDTGNIFGDAKIGRAPWGVHIMESDEERRYIATMSCIIQVAGARFGLTTAHAFYNSSNTGDGAHDMDTDDSDEDSDDEYDIAPGPEKDNYGKDKMDLRPASPLNSRGNEVRLGKALVCIPPREDTSAWVQKHANLDWALVDLGLEKATFATAADRRIVAKHLPKRCLDVFVNTRAHLDVPATLYNVPSYMGGAKGTQATETWTLGRVPESFHVRKGDSGSIVTDSLSGELYGMVVAANPFGDIHIVPLTAILEQVKEWFQTQDVFVFDLPRDLKSTRQESGRLARSKSFDSSGNRKPHMQWLANYEYRNNW